MCDKREEGAQGDRHLPARLASEILNKAGISLSLGDGPTRQLIVASITSFYIPSLDLAQGVA